MVSRQCHELEKAGSIPAPATKGVKMYYRESELFSDPENWERWEMAFKNETISPRTYMVIIRAYWKGALKKPPKKINEMSDADLMKLRQVGPLTLKEIRKVFPLSDLNK